MSRARLVALSLLAITRSLALLAIAVGLATAIASLADGLSPVEGAIWAAVGVAGRSLAQWAASVVAARGAAAAKTETRRELLERIAAGGLPGGPAAVVATRGLDDLDEYFIAVLPATIGAVVVPLVVGVAILGIDPLSALVVGVTLPLVPLFMVLIGMHTRERSAAALTSLERLAGHLVELVRGLPVIVGVNRVGEQTAALGRVQDEYRARTQRTLRTAFLSALALELISTLSVAVIAVTLGIRLLSGDVPLAAALAVLLLAPECFGAVKDVGTAFHAAQAGRAARARVGELLATPAPRGGLRPAATTAAPASGSALQRLTVRYPDRRAPAVAGFTAEFPVGEVTALTGPSGCGKSTVLSALAGVLPAGTKVTGRLRDVDPARIAWSPQTPHFYADTPRAELALGSGSAAAPAAILTELGLTHLADAPIARLSPGEQRRLAVARALMRVDAGATLLLLDEPTAHLDEAAADRVRTAILRRRALAAIVLVSHEPETLDIADSSVAVVGSALARPASHAAANLPADQVPLREQAAAPESTRDRHDATRALGAIVGPSLGRWILAVLGGVAAVGCGLALTALSGWLIVQASEQPAIMYLLVAIVGVRFFGLARSAFRYLERLASHAAVFVAIDGARLRMWRSLAALGPSARHLLRGGSALDLLVSVADAVRDALPRVLTPLLVAGLAVAGVIVTTGLLAPTLTLLVAIGLIVTVAGSLVVALVGAPGASSRLATVRSDLIRRVQALAESADDLAANGLATAALADLAQVDAERSALERRSSWASGGAGSLAAFGTGLLAVAIVMASAGSQLAASTVAALALLMLAMAEPVIAATAAAHRVPGLAAGLSMMAPLLDPTTAVDRAGAAIEVPIGGLTARDLTATWPGGERPVFIPVDADIARGGWLVVEGPSGAGKSTLLTILLGALVPSTGRLLADGRDVYRELDAEAWRGRVAWCPQEAHVFDSTIRGNLLLARPRDLPVTDDEMHEVLGRVGLARLIASLPDGLGTRVGSEGGTLSGGERQRLAVARALLGNADILLLDEPTAHLDAPTASAMMDDVRRAAGDRIVVLVSHRADDRRSGDVMLSLQAGDAESEPLPWPAVPAGSRAASD